MEMAVRVIVACLLHGKENRRVGFTATVVSILVEVR